MLRVGRDGGLQNFELHGLVTLRISDEKLGRIRVQLENKDTRGIQLQVRQYKLVSVIFFFLVLCATCPCIYLLHAKRVVQKMMSACPLQYKIPLFLLDKCTFIFCS